MKMASKSSKSSHTFANCFNQKRISEFSELFDLARISNELMQSGGTSCRGGGGMPAGQNNDGTGRVGIGGMPAGSDDIAYKERQRWPEENKRKGKGGSDPIFLRITNAAANPGAPVQTEPETVDFFFLATCLQIPEHQFFLNRKPWTCNERQRKKTIV